MNRHRFIEIAIGHQIRQRPESFFLHDFKIRARRRQTRFHVTAAGKPRAIEFLAAVKNLAAFAFHLLDGTLHILQRCLIDERTHQSFAIERVPDVDRFVSSEKPLAHFVSDRFMHDDAARRSASLAGGPDRAEEDRACCHVEDGRGCDDERVVAAEFHHGASEPTMNFLRHIEAHPRRAGGGHKRNQAIRREFFPDGWTVANEQTEDRWIGAGFPADALGNLDYRNRRERSFFRRLPNRGVAADRRERGIPGPNRDRKVES